MCIDHMARSLVGVSTIANSCYFAIRSGGRTLLTMIFDSIYIWAVCVPYTYALVT
ncbi:MAG TPA: MATE family efflux transporter, partial [Firmicutes bacterium]|nr:MATE family efflux transporter [Bacillota bacterium]